MHPNKRTQSKCNNIHILSDPLTQHISEIDSDSGPLRTHVSYWIKICHSQSKPETSVDSDTPFRSSRAKPAQPQPRTFCLCGHDYNRSYVYIYGHPCAHAQLRTVNICVHMDVCVYVMRVCMHAHT